MIQKGRFLFGFFGKNQIGLAGFGEIRHGFFGFG